MFKRMAMKRYSLFVLSLISVTLVCSVFALGQETMDKKAVPSIISEIQPQDKADEHMVEKVIAAVVFIVVIFGGFIGYMIYLQKKFYDGCREDNQMATFFSSPAGLPVGTIRAIIALIIITVSLSLIVINVFVGVGDFPTVLVGLLGTVLGFYFGSRSTGTGDDAAQAQIKGLKTQRDDAVTKQDTAQSNTIVAKIKDGVAMSKTALQFLPEAERTKYGGYLTKLEQGLGVIDNFTKAGDLKQAGAKAAEIFEEYKQGNPAQGAFNDAVKAFGQVLGNAVPAIAIASTVVILCSKLAGAVYQKWKARVLQAPFSPAIISLKVADANTGFTILNSALFSRRRL